jgi:hypothetical protein
MKTLLPYLLICALLMGAAVVLGQSDPITSAVVNARAETAAGPVMMNVANQTMVMILKWISGATIAGLVGAAFVEGRKLYQRWWREENTRRYRRPQMQPNVNRSTSRFPKMTREDLMLMMLGNRGAQGNYRMPVAREERDDDDLNIQI